MSPLKGAHIIESNDDYAVIATDDDGDGIYSDVHYAHIIESNDDYTVIATDDNGDGLFNNIHYVHVIPQNSWANDSQPTAPSERTENSNSSSSSYSGYTGGGSINWKKVGIAALVILAIYGIITLWDYIQFLFH